ncbi:MAG: FAD-dependent oxidoreductase, partial [Verrucomicrobiota bacterium]
ILHRLCHACTCTGGKQLRQFGKWGWIDEEFAYTTRRLIDGMGMDEIDHPDILLINNPSIDYPLDVWPDHVAADLEEHAAGASKKSLVEMTPVEREIVFADARAHTLKYYYHLQQKFPKFRRMGLSKEFGTADHLPPKPYIRESLRMVAEHIVKEQEVLGFESRSNYATTMFPDAVFGWQFELDFHPTKRSFVTDEGSAGPWEADFRGARRFGRGGTGRAVFPLRALIPADVDGLLGAQKNLGYTSIVSSSCRLHDQSIHVGQAAGAAAAVSLRHDVDPSTFIDEPDRLSEIWAGLLEVEDGAGLAIWPFSDVDPHDPDFAAIQHLALRRCLPLDQSDTAFQPDEVATPEWIAAAVKATKDAGYNPPSIIITRTERRRLIANRIWKHISKQPTKPLVVREWKRDPKTDGLPEDGAWDLAINFTAPKEESAEGFLNNHGSRDSGWGRDLSKNNRFRNSDGHPLRDGFVFTRQKDVWTTEIENGTWQVVICLGDSGHEQPGQFLRIQDELVAEDVHTAAGRFLEVHAEVQVTNRQLRVTLGREEGGSNTCINWLVAKRLTENE